MLDQAASRSDHPSALAVTAIGMMREIAPEMHLRETQHPKAEPKPSARPIQHGILPGARFVQKPSVIPSILALPEQLKPKGKYLYKLMPADF